MQNKIFLLSGNNSFFRRKEREKIIQEFQSLEKGTVFRFNLTPGSPEELKTRISRKIRSYSFFQEKELILIKVELPERKTSQGKKGARDKVSSGKKKMGFFHESFVASLILKIPKHITLIIEIDGVLEKNSILKNLFEKISDSQTIDFSTKKGGETIAIRSLVNNYLLQEKITISSALIEELINKNKDDYWSIFNSLEQAVLLFHAKDKNDNLNDSLANLWELREEKKIFSLLDAIGRKDQKNALSLLYQIISENTIRFGGEIPAVLGLVSLLKRQITQLLALKENISPQEATKKWGIPPFAYTKTQYHSSLFGEQFLCSAYEGLLNIQQKAKSGLNSPLPLLDFLILRLISH